MAFRFSDDDEERDDRPDLKFDWVHEDQARGSSFVVSGKGRDFEEALANAYPDEWSDYEAYGLEEYGDAWLDEIDYTFVEHLDSDNIGVTEL